MNDYRNLLVWQRAHELTLLVYRETRRFPKEELFGVTSQLRRAASSIPANIAEGNGRATRKDYLHFLVTARGSLNEVRYFTLLANDLSYLTAPQRSQIDMLLDHVSKLLAGLIRSLQRND